MTKQFWRPESFGSGKSSRPESFGCREFLEARRTSASQFPKWRGACFALGLWFACCGLIGCRVTPQIGVTDTGAPRYDRAMVVYELNGMQRPLPLHLHDISQVGFENQPPAEEVVSQWAGAKLSIQYPHPDGDQELARATLRLSSRPGDQADGSGRLFGFDLLSNRDFQGTNGENLPQQPDDEIWVLDFPKQQLDLLLADLAGSGFFEQQMRQTVGTHLDVQVDRGRTQKTWTPEPRLDDFVARVYTEGRLGGLVPCRPHNG